ncbi:MAG: aromatic amino acid transport family protein [Rhabdochlamydiaceae bacterium]|nr:aromatic amino acid transport family protein [Candidatus Amphrikana amoebophyrae]
MSQLSYKISLATKALGAILLISGTAIGGGMIALPVVTAPIGFFPSIVSFLITWLIMTFTAFLLLECNLSMKGNVNLISMCKNTLGPKGEAVAWVSYLLLLYSLLAVYISGTNSIISYIFAETTGQTIGPIMLIGMQSVIIISIVVIGIKAVDYFNRFLVLGATLCYFLLIGVISPHINYDNLILTKSITWALPFPVLVTAFGYHIIIPSLVTYLNRNVRMIRICLWIGSCIPLILYFGWQIAIMGALPSEGDLSLIALTQAKDSLQGLIQSTSIVTSSKVIPVVMSGLCCFAILTSLLGVAISLWDFFKDAITVSSKSNSPISPAFNETRVLNMAYETPAPNSAELHESSTTIRSKKGQKISLALLTFVPPMLLVMLAPNLFIALLGYAGIFVAILLGILPILMCWSGRRQPTWGYNYRVVGGKLSMCGSLLFFLYVIILQIFQ